MIRSMAKYSMKNSAECRSAWPYMVCSMAWPVRSAAAQVRWGRLLPQAVGMAPEGPLRDLPALAARERPAPMPELVDGFRRVAPHVFDGALAAEPVRPLHGV